MQLYAHDPSQVPKRPILANEAEKGKDYLCPECKNFLRIRGGNNRQIHFFHLKTPLSCRQHQKGIIHIQLQLYLQSLLSEEETQLEAAFPSIGRIADVACLKTKKIFEIQYSPISLHEAKGRTEDYARIGFQIVWILHDRRFNKKNLSAAEEYLRQGTCYFTNMDHEGGGKIYDQFEIIQKGKRVYRASPLNVDLKCAKKNIGSSLELPKMLQKRLEKQPLYHQGDLADHFFSGRASFLLDLEKKFSLKKSALSPWKKIKEGYHILIQLLLEGVAK